MKTLCSLRPSRLLPALLIALLLAAAVARAEQSKVFGDLEVHYILLNTTDLAPDMAALYDIPRAENLALLNISGRKRQQDGTTTAAPLQLSGSASNLLGQLQQLNFRKVSEPGAIYYLAEIRFSDQETLRFDIAVREPEQSLRHELKFQQQLWQQ